MLVVKVELWPAGSAARAREIGRMGIANVTGSPVSDYIAVRVDGALWDCKLINSHARTDGFWPLIARAADREGTDAEPIATSGDLFRLAVLVYQRMHDPGV